MTNKELLKSAIGGYCEYKTTKEIGMILNISTAKAYKICLEQEATGWLGCLGYRVHGGGFADRVQGSDLRSASLCWQNCDNSY